MRDAGHTDKNNVVGLIALALETGMAVAGATPAMAAPVYSITDLGTLDGTYSAGLGINSSGDVVGLILSTQMTIL